MHYLTSSEVSNQAEYSSFHLEGVLNANLITSCGVVDSSASDCPSYSKLKAWSAKL